MKVNNVAKIAITVIALILLAQLFSLIRSYANPPSCTRVVPIWNKFHVLINCDSSVWLKDSNDVDRLFNGQSVYRDRPMGALTAKGLSNLLDGLGIQNQNKAFKSNSGRIDYYSTNQYLGYIFINLFVLLFSLFLVFKLFMNTSSEINYYKSKTTSLLLVNLLVFVGLNEVTKTFFWTPHTQIFNLLFPILSLYFLKIKDEITNAKIFLTLVTLVNVLTFFYPIFFLTHLILVFFRRVSLNLRIFSFSFSCLLISGYRIIINILGGDYVDIPIAKYRQFVWPFDILSGKEPPQLLLEKFLGLINSFPLIPVIIVALIMTFRQRVRPTQTKIELLSNVNVLLYSSVYFLFLFGVGLGVRRITFGLVIFVLVAVSLKSVDIFHKIKYVHIFGSVVLLIQIFSWFFTSGPLI